MIFIAVRNSNHEYDYHIGQHGGRLKSIGSTISGYVSVKVEQYEASRPRRHRLDIRKEEEKERVDEVLEWAVLTGKSSKYNCFPSSLS